MEWITPRQAMAILGVGEAKVYALIRERKLPAYRTGDGPRARYRLRAEEVNAFLEERRTFARPKLTTVAPSPARKRYVPKFDHGF